MRENDVGSVILSTLNIDNYQHVARYEAAQRTMARTSVVDAEMQVAVNEVNTVEAQIRRKQRSQAYGGLPCPDEFEDGEGK
jgi:hypothetical protein